MVSTVIKAKYYKASVDMWSEEGVVHAIDEPGLTQCGIRYRSGFKTGWFVERAWFSEAVTCKRCLRALAKQASSNS